jgi:hypothetical protein
VIKEFRSTIEVVLLWWINVVVWKKSAVLLLVSVHGWLSAVWSSCGRVVCPWVLHLSTPLLTYRPTAAWNDPSEIRHRPWYARAFTVRLAMASSCVTERELVQNHTSDMYDRQGRHDDEQTKTAQYYGQIDRVWTFTGPKKQGTTRASSVLNSMVSSSGFFISCQKDQLNLLGKENGIDPGKAHLEPKSWWQSPYERLAGLDCPAANDCSIDWARHHRWSVGPGAGAARQRKKMTDPEKSCKKELETWTWTHRVHQSVSAALPLRCTSVYSRLLKCK